MLRIRGLVVAFLLASGAAFAVATANAATFTVNNLENSGDGSLRWAIAQANGNTEANTIVFNLLAPAPNTTNTIVLTTGPLNIQRGPLTIIGPGAALLTIDGNSTGNIFAIVEANTTPDHCPNPTTDTDFLVSISHMTLRNGRRDRNGGAIVSLHSLTLDSMVIRDNVSGRGGSVAWFTQPFPNHVLPLTSSNVLTINNVQFINNAANIASNTRSNRAGALYINEECVEFLPTVVTTATITGSVFERNRVQSDQLDGAGGAIAAFMSGSLTITDSRIIDNHIDGLNPPTPPTTSPRLRGSGIYAQVKTLTIVRSEIADNSATGVANPGGAVGGGLNVENNASTLLPAGESMVVTIINSTISGNAVSGSGGAMGVSGNVTVELDNSTFSDNSAPSTGTGGILIETASATAPTLAVVSSILAKNTGNGLDVVTGSGIDTFTINATSSLIGAICSTCNVSPPSGSGNLLGYDPLLGPLAFNGGPTRTQALLAGSPAIDTGSNPPPPDPLTDQRGVVRAQGLAPDMGAFELQDATPPVVLCDVPDDAWHSSDVTIGCTASDPESGLDIPADATFNLTTNTAPGTETAIAATGSYSVRNNLGAFTQAGPITPNKVDKKPPTITITSPTANATYQVSANVGASYACADGGSGVASCAGTVANGGLIDTSTTGSKTFTVNATDNVSNGASPFNVTYSVVSGGGGGTSYADVGITLSAANSVPSGGTLTYSMTVTNSGPATATGVVASVAIPAGAVFASASAPQGVTVAAPPVGSGGTVTANLGTLAKGATATINVAVTVTAPYTSKATLTSTASVTATTPDKISTNNSATKVTSMTKK